MIRLLPPRARPGPFVLLILLGLLPGVRARAGDPTQRWRTIETPHFYIHYYRSARHDERELAQRVAVTAEAVHRDLTRALEHTPSGRTHLVLTDETDGANASAQIIPMNILRLYAVGPTSISSLNDYEDWIYALLLHEYTHILHIDTIHGLAKLVNYVMGKTWAPNQVQPKWFTEGLAIYYESSRSSGGRVRNAIFDMYLRMSVLEGRTLELDQITSNTRIFPRGNVPYLYGARFVAYLVDRFGEEKITRVSHRYGSTVVPYAINRIAKEVLGFTYVELYRDFKQYLQRRYALQRELARSRGLTAFTTITDHGESTGVPVVSRDGQELAYIDSDGHSMNAFKVVDLKSGRLVQRRDHFGGSGMDFTPDRQHLVYGGAATWKTFYSYDDLFVWHRASGRTRRLSHGLRARDPAVSPDGKTVAFVTTELGDMSLMTIPFQGGSARVLFKGANGDQVFTPRWSPDGKQLVYSRWRRGGDRDIYLMEVASGRSRPLTSDRATDLDPIFSPDGQRVYFSSDRTGIYNIYCHELGSNQLWQVSNVLGGAFSAALTPDEKSLYYVGFSAKGFDLHRMSLERTRYLPALPYVSTRPAPRQLDGPAQAFPERTYNPLTTLYPRSWMFNVGNDSFGTALGLQLLGSDVAGLHRWSLNTSVGTARGHLAYGFSYGYYGLWPSLDLDTSRFVTVRGGAMKDGVKQNFVEENYGGGLNIGLPVLSTPEHFFNINLGYRLNVFRNTDDDRYVLEPGVISPVRPPTGFLSGVSLSLNYSNVLRYAWSISNEKGRNLGLSLRFDHPSLGSDAQATTFTWGWTEYLSMPWLKDHVLALRYSGGVGSSDWSRRALFFLGGFPEQDVLRSFFDPNSRIGGSFLRGYPAGMVFGDQYHLINVEYRLPIYNIERGLSSLPLYFNHIHGAVFVDAGNAFFGEPSFGETKVGVGAELLLEITIGYFIGSTFRVGYARGLMDKGGNEFHFLLGNAF